MLLRNNFWKYKKKKVSKYASVINKFKIFNSREAIAEAVIGLLLVFFTTRRGELVFSRFFLQEVDLFTRFFDLKAKVRKAVLVNRFSLSERSFLIIRCV